MRLKRLLIFVATLGVILSGLGCQTTTNTTVGNSPCCAVFNRIYPSPKDTDATLGQIYEHNKVYDMLCNGQNEEKKETVEEKLDRLEKLQKFSIIQGMSN